MPLSVDEERAGSVDMDVDDGRCSGWRVEGERGGRDTSVDGNWGDCTLEAVKTFGFGATVEAFCT